MPAAEVPGAKVLAAEVPGAGVPDAAAVSVAAALESALMEEDRSSMRRERVKKKEGNIGFEGGRSVRQYGEGWVLLTQIQGLFCLGYNDRDRNSLL